MKRIAFISVVIIVLTICISVYFRPYSLFETISENNQFYISLMEMGIRYGKPYIDYFNFENRNLRNGPAAELLKKCTYRRTIGTLFSRGGWTDSGSRILSICSYDGSSTTNMVMISSTGKVLVHGKIYHMDNTEEFLDEIKLVLQKQ